MNLKNTVIGIEFGSTRIKAVMLDEDRKVCASGSFLWENRLENNIWTYDLKDVVLGMQTCFKELKKDFEEKYNTVLSETGAIGISGMMHGLLAFDKNMGLLTPFRTWRNTITQQAAEKLSEEFQFNVPQRWSISHYYQDILDEKPYVKDIDFFTTLSGYVHYLLTGEKVLGICEASGMFPIDSKILDYNKTFVEKFKKLDGVQITDLLPKVLVAGNTAGYLTKEGARLLDISGDLKWGIPLAPPEGDGGTGMVATNSVKINTGNVSAGTSIFAMVVVDRMPKMYREIDMITTPDGNDVAMVHCNNCTTDINGWAGLFKEFADFIGADKNMGEIYSLLFKKALEGEKDCGGLLSYNYFSGEGITDVNEGVPVFMRTPDSHLTLANFMRTHIYSTVATLRMGLDLLTEKENIKIDNLLCHGGLFKTPGVADRIMSAAAKCEVTVLPTASEGGPYGMALLAAYLLDKKEEDLGQYLDEKIFSRAEKTKVLADQADIDGFEKFMENYKKAFNVELEAINFIK